MSFKAIGDYGIIGNMLSAALVGTDGSIDWCCMPRFDSPSVFAAMLDDEKGGRFHIRPRASFRSRQTYLENTNVLQTVFEADTGTVELVDFMPCYRTARGRLNQFSEVHRLARCTEGEVAMGVLFEPRLSYARGRTSLNASRQGVTASRDAESLALSSPLPFAVDGGAAACEFVLHEGEEARFVLRHGHDRPGPVKVYDTAGKLERTAAYWREKAEGCMFSGPWREAIVRSYLALHLLMYHPTGAVVAAPTTSLPEQIGGERNWDYRYAWLRDASLTFNALFYLGHIEEALGFFNWLTAVCDRCGARAQILYSIDFGSSVVEQELDHLKGYRCSRPVRVGNGAFGQLQLDVFGELLEAAHNYLKMGGYISQRTWRSLESFVEAACELWRRPDNGIWEIRGGPYHFVHSKLLCWVAVDRGVKIAEKMGYRKGVERWRETASEIREEVLTKGWNAEKGAFRQHYDTAALDASSLLMPLFDFLPASDWRMASTIERTVEELSWNGLLRRYRTDETDDGLSGSEGAFLWCSFWLVRNLVRTGRLGEGVKLFERLLGYRNHLGLLSEMVDPVAGEALGNFPQALSHLAVIIAGLELTGALGCGRKEDHDANLHGPGGGGP